MMQRLQGIEELDNIAALDSQVASEGGHRQPIVPKDVQIILERGEQAEGTGSLYLHNIRWRPQ
eukprot:4936684-Pyramimonas_sp.AAC.1